MYACMCWHTQLQTEVDTLRAAALAREQDSARERKERACEYERERARVGQEEGHKVRLLEAEIAKLQQCVREAEREKDSERVVLEEECEKMREVARKGEWKREKEKESGAVQVDILLYMYIYIYVYIHICIYVYIFI